MSLRARITLIATATAVIVIVLFGTLVDAAARATVRAQQDLVLSQLSQSATQRVTQYSPTTLRRASVATVIDIGVSSAEFLEVFDSAGAVAYSTGVLNGNPVAVPLPTLSQAVDPASPAVTSISASGVSIRLNIRPVAHLGADPGGWVVAGASLSAQNSSIDQLTRLISVLAAVLIAGCAVILSVLARRTLAPLQRAAATAEAVRVDQNLSRRLPPTPHDDEVGRLAASINGMLEELQHTHAELDSALTSQRRFIADASHELRTPLTSIRSNVEFLVGRTDAAEQDRADAMADIESESARMVRMVDDLLTLARADAGQRLERGPVDVAALVQQVGRQATKVYPDRVVTVATVGDLSAVGNADAITQLGWILVNNAARHTAPGGHIAIESARGDDGVVFQVTDDGPGIPEPDLTRIFERFYQVGASRELGGSGLGLSIAAWIVTEHQGTMVAANVAPHGARFTVRFPFSADS